MKYDHFYEELQRFMFKCEHEVTFIDDTLQDADHSPEARAQLMASQHHFRASATAAQVALAFLDSAAEQLLHNMHTADDPVIRDIARDYTKDGTLDF
jgi:hypothetical protein